nr:hypothetical protein [uncultured Shimia sp.]
MTRGFLFAATGPDYTSLAQQAAATVATHHPDIDIDLFTDQDCDFPVFSQIHKLTQNTTRPRFEALLRSRFSKTICLDSDLFVLASIADVFDVLDRFDIALAHDQRLNISGHTLVRHTKPIPAAFPQYNSGVIGLKKSAQTDAFLTHWKTAFEQSPLKIDQPILRETLFDSDLRIATLPPQYNIIDCDLIRSWDTRTIAPRVLHSSRIRTPQHHADTDIRTPIDLVGPQFLNHINAWQNRDATLVKHPIPERLPAFCDSYPTQKIAAGDDPFAGRKIPIWKRLAYRLSAFVLRENS